MTDQQKESVKLKIAEYITRKGHTITNELTRCIDPGHTDNNPSCSVGDQFFRCHSCGAKGDIFKAAGLLIGSSSFPDQVAEVCGVLGITEERDHVTGTGKKTNCLVTVVDKPKKDQLIPVSPDQYKQIWNNEAVERLRQFAENRKPGSWGSTMTTSWPYMDTDGNYLAFDVRFEGGNRSKNIVTIYYNGSNLKSSGAPVLIYNLPGAISNDRPIVFHEGAKCAKLAEVILGWTSCSWSGGSKKAHLVDLSPLADAGIKSLWYYPDRDLKKDKEGNPLHPVEQPGRKAAIDFAANCQKYGIACHIIPPYPGIDGDGADIEQVLQIASPEEVGEYFRTVEPWAPPVDKPVKEKKKAYRPSPPKGIDSDAFPFQILGTGDDGLTYFIGAHDRMYSWRLDRLSENQICLLASYDKWENMFPKAGSKWARIAKDTINQVATQIDFDPSIIKGRGAYWNDDHEPYYFDGRDFYGTPSTKFIHPRRIKEDVGINDNPASWELRRDIKEVAKKVSFSSRAHMIRLLAWALLSPWCGLYKARPCALFTGPPGSGKSYIAAKMIRPLAAPKWFDGGQSSPIGTMAAVNRDAYGLVLEETEGDTDKKDEYREGHFSNMRSAYTEDAPPAVKGLQDGGFRTTTYSNMFLFIAVDPKVQADPDEDRIFRIETKMENDGDDRERVERFKPIGKEIARLFTEKNCRMIRAYTWTNIKVILKCAEKIDSNIEAATGKDFRYCQAESMLLAAYLLVFESDKWSPEDFSNAEYVNNFLDLLYKSEPIERRETGAARMLDTILQHIVDIDRQKYTVRDVAWKVMQGPYGFDKAETEGENETQKMIDVAPFKRALGNIGIAVVEPRDLKRPYLAIMKTSRYIEKDIKLKKDYWRQIERDGRCDKLLSRNANIRGQGSRACLLIDIFKEDE